MPTEVKGFRPGYHGVSFETSGAAEVGTSATTIVTLQTRGMPGELSFELDNITGGQALTTFVMQAQDHQNGEWYDYLSGTDWMSSGITNMLFSSTDPTTLASGSKSHHKVLVRAAWAIRFQATVASSTTDVDMRGTFNGDR